jgi:hypothetical protein
MSNIIMYFYILEKEEIEELSRLPQKFAGGGRKLGLLASAKGPGFFF